MKRKRKPAKSPSCVITIRDGQNRVRLTGDMWDAVYSFAPADRCTVNLRLVDAKIKTTTL